MSNQDHKTRRAITRANRKPKSLDGVLKALQEADHKFAQDKKLREIKNGQS